MYGKLYGHMTLIGTSCVNSCVMRVMLRFLVTHPQKAAVQFLFENGEKSKIFVDYFSCSALSTSALVVSSMDYLPDHYPLKVLLCIRMETGKYTSCEKVWVS